VIEEYKSCVMQHDLVLDVDNEETEFLVAVRFRQHDVFELFICALSRLVVESLLSALFCEVIKTRTNQFNDDS